MRHSIHYLRKFIGLVRMISALSVIALAGCAGPSAVEYQEARRIDANTPLKKVEMPGGRSISGSQTANTTLPQAEPYNISQDCTISALSQLKTLKGVDTSAMGALYEESQQFARARNTQRADVAVTQSQRHIINSYLARINPNRLQLLRQQERAHKIWRERIWAAQDAGKMTPDLRARLMREQPQFPRTDLHQVPGADDDLRFNEAILAAREQRLSAENMRIGQAMVSQFQGAVRAFLVNPIAETNLTILRDFETFRTKNFIPCIDNRIQLNEESSNALRLDTQAYFDRADQAVKVNGNELLRIVRASGSLAGFDSTLEATLGSPQLVQTALRQIALGEELRRVRSGFDAQEKQARIAEQQRQEAIVRQQAERKIAELNEKIRRNPPPSNEDVRQFMIKLSLKLSKESSDKNLGELSFELLEDGWLAYKPPFDASNWSFRMIFTDVTNLKCRPERESQRCTFVHGTDFIRRDPLFGTETPSGTLSRENSVLFRWAQKGLTSPDEITVSAMTTRSIETTRNPMRDINDQNERIQEESNRRSREAAERGLELFRQRQAEEALRRSGR